MKIISKATATNIEDFSAETELSLPAYALEKDLHVVDAIRAISAMEPSEHFRMVFCGGTCLAKAHGILERMSEDVDFKVVPTEAGAALGAGALRKRLSAWVKEVIRALENAGFGEGSVERRSLDENKYTALDVSYDSVFEKPHSLRSHLLIELNFATPGDATIDMPIGALLDRLAKGAYTDPLLIECVSPREALAEKLISFPRRLALQLSRMAPGETLGQSGTWDGALVRHLYDVGRIVSVHPELIAEAGDAKARRLGHPQRRRRIRGPASSVRGEPARRAPRRDGLGEGKR